jgi:hypothetical protein
VNMRHMLLRIIFYYTVRRSLLHKNCNSGGTWGLLPAMLVKVNRPWRPIGLWDVEASTFSVENLLTDGGKVSPTRRPHFTPRKIPGTHFC